MPATVLISEAGPGDGLQSLARTLSVLTMLALVPDDDVIALAGLPPGFVHADGRLPVAAPPRAQADGALA